MHVSSPSIDKSVPPGVYLEILRLDKSMAIVAFVITRPLSHEFFGEGVLRCGIEAPKSHLYRPDMPPEIGLGLCWPKVEVKGEHTPGGRDFGTWTEALMD